MGEHWIDRAWKDVLRGDMDGAISFFLPTLAAERDRSKMPEAADAARQAIGGKSDRDANVSDVCFKVPLRSGETPRTLFLIEQQHNEARGKSLPLRVFQSWYRASDEYRYPVTALVLYTGDAKPVNSYRKEWHGTSVHFTFNTYCVPEEADAEALKLDPRPFAIPILAAKRMLDAKGDPKKRGVYSLELLELIRGRGLGGEKEGLFGDFVGRILQVDEDDMDETIREVWKMQFKPQDEVLKEILLRGAEERRVLEIARNLRANGVSLDVIAQSTGLDKEELAAHI